jgi:Uma2 family endonuclease
MDPYLEAPGLWPGLHQRLITYTADELQLLVRPNYRAQMGERLYVMETSRDIYPDVALIQRPSREPASAGVSKPAATETILVADPPFVVDFLLTEYREPFIEIVHSASGQVVTVIEILSPANKAPGKGYELYRQKQQEILNSQVHLVEIDLLSQGLYTIAMPETGLTRLPSHRYLVNVSRSPDRHHFELYPISLSQRLPRCRIPLKAPDADITLDLPTIFNRCYDNGGYADFVDYTQPPLVPLSEEEEKWITENVKI